MSRLIKDIKTWELIILWQLQKLLMQRENKLTGQKKYARNDWTRPMIQFIYMNYDRRELKGVEIGVAGGGNAFSMMNMLPMEKLYLVDPFSYLMYPETGYTDSNQLQFEECMEGAIKLLSPFGNKVEFIRKTSDDAAVDVPDGLDFVYIDGNHTLDYVRRDLEKWYPKVKKGGIFGGDNFESQLPDVARAVLEFTDKNNLKIYGGRSEVSYEWWVIKN